MTTHPADSDNVLQFVRNGVLYYTSRNSRYLNKHLDDMVQDASIAVFLANPSETAGSNPDAYIRKCIRNSCHDYYRKLRRMPASVSFDAPQGNGLPLHEYLRDTTLSNSIQTIECQDMLLRARKRYTGVQKKGIEALCLQLLGHDYSDIAHRYGTTPANVRAWVSLARTVLRNDPEVLHFFDRSIQPKGA